MTGPRRHSQGSRDRYAPSPAYFNRKYAQPPQSYAIALLGHGKEPNGMEAGCLPDTLAGTSRFPPIVHPAYFKRLLLRLRALGADLFSSGGVSRTIPGRAFAAAPPLSTRGLSVYQVRFALEITLPGGTITL